MQELKSFARNEYENLKSQAPPAEERSKKALAIRSKSRQKQSGMVQACERRAVQEKEVRVWEELSVSSRQGWQEARIVVKLTGSWS